MNLAMYICWFIYTCFIYLFVMPPIHIYLILFVYMLVYLTFCISPYVYFLSVSLAISVLFCVSVCLSICLSIYLYSYLHTWLYIIYVCLTLFIHAMPLREHSVLVAQRFVYLSNKGRYVPSCCAFISHVQCHRSDASVSLANPSGFSLGLNDAPIPATYYITPVIALSPQQQWSN